MKNILVVDDFRPILDGLSDCLTAEGYTVFTAENGAQAIDILNFHPVDLVITDLSMPVMNGLELLIHTKKNYPSVPVFVMTADYSPVMKERLSRLGAAQCIGKPFNFEDLTDKISVELEGASKGQEQLAANFTN